MHFEGERMRRCYKVQQLRLKQEGALDAADETATRLVMMQIKVEKRMRVESRDAKSFNITSPPQ